MGGSLPLLSNGKETPTKVKEPQPNAGPNDLTPKGTSATEQRWLDYGNFFIVALGLVLAMVGFVVIIIAISSGLDKAEALGFLTALFGVITGLVGTFFGIKASADAAKRAQDSAPNPQLQQPTNLAPREMSGSNK